MNAKLKESEILSSCLFLSLVDVFNGVAARKDENIVTGYTAGQKANYALFGQKSVKKRADFFIR